MIEARQAQLRRLGALAEHREILNAIESAGLSASEFVVLTVLVGKAQDWHGFRDNTTRGLILIGTAALLTTAQRLKAAKAAIEAWKERVELIYKARKSTKKTRGKRMKTSVDGMAAARVAEARTVAARQARSALQADT